MSGYQQLDFGFCLGLHATSNKEPLEIQRAVKSYSISYFNTQRVETTCVAHSEGNRSKMNDEGNNSAEIIILVGLYSIRSSQMR